MDYGLPVVSPSILYQKVLLYNFDIRTAVKCAVSAGVVRSDRFCVTLALAGDLVGGDTEVMLWRSWLPCTPLPFQPYGCVTARVAPFYVLHLVLAMVIARVQYSECVPSHSFTVISRSCVAHLSVETKGV